jgi:hypothetical protein
MLLYNPLVISKVWDTTMTKTPSLTPSKSEIWYFIEFRNQMDATNYSACGKDLLSSPWSSDQDHTSWWLKTVYQSETHGTSASYGDSMPKGTRQIFSQRCYVIKVHDQFNKDNAHHQHLSHRTWLSRVVFTTRMRANRLQGLCSTYPRLFNLDESNTHSSYPNLFNSDESNTHSPYPKLFNLDESKWTLALS